MRAAQRRTRWWVEALAIAWLCWVYDAITEPRAAAPAHGAGACARAVQRRAARSASIRSAPSTAGWPGTTRSACSLSDYYDNAHFIVTLGLLGWLWWRRADIYRPLRNTLVLANVIAFVVFWRFPVAPPRMLPGFTDVVAATQRVRLLAQRRARRRTPTSSPRCPRCTSRGHCGARSRCGARPAAALVRALAALYPCVTAAAVLATGNHFVLDMLGGALTLALAATLVRVWAALAQRSRRPDESSRAPAAAADAPPRVRPACRMSQSCYEVPSG